MSSASHPHSPAQPPADPAAARPARQKRWPEVLVLAAYALLVLLTTLRHEIWKDEAQAWLIACSSDNLADLFGFLEIEAHPALWYLCLWVLSRFSDHVLLMQLFHALLAIVTAALLVFCAPMRFWQRAMAVFGYYLVYEYAIIARNYVLGALLCFAVCALVSRRNRAMIWIGVLLALLANTSAQGAILGAGLGGGLAVDWLVGWRARRPQLAPAWHVVLAALLCAGGLLASYAVVAQYPTDTPRITQTYVRIQSPGDALEKFLPLSRAIVPLPQLDAHPWGTHILATASSRAVRFGFAALGLLIALAACVLLLPKPAVWTTAIVAGGGLWMLMAFVFEGFPRHHGHYFILLLVVMWLWHEYPTLDWPRLRALQSVEQRHQPIANVLLGLVLALHMFAGLQLIALDLLGPFSRAREVAAYLREHYPPDTLVMGYPDTESSSVRAQLRRPVFYLESQSFGGPVNWVLRGRTPEDADPIALAREALKQQAPAGEWAVLLLQNDEQSRDGVELVLEKRFTPGREQFIIYRARLAGGE